MESVAHTHRRIVTGMGLLLVVLLLWWLLRPTAVSDVGLDRRRAQLERAIRERDEIPSILPVNPAPAPANPEPVAVMVIPPAVPEPAPIKQPPLPHDAYMERVHRYLRTVELRHYDELAVRKESFTQKMQAEEKRIDQQMAQLAGFQAPLARLELPDAIKRRLTYCYACHKPRDPVELADMFARAGNFH